MKASRQIFDADKYKGEWVAFDPKTRRVISHDKSFAKARMKAKNKGIKRPLMHGVPESEGFFIGGGMVNDG